MWALTTGTGISNVSSIPVELLTYISNTAVSYILYKSNSPFIIIILIQLIIRNMLLLLHQWLHQFWYPQKLN